MFSWRAFLKLEPVLPRDDSPDVTVLKSSNAAQCARRLTNVRELSLSLCASNPIASGVAGACALALFKGRDELSGCIHVRDDPRTRPEIP